MEIFRFGNGIIENNKFWVQGFRDIFLIECEVAMKFEWKIISKIQILIL